MFDLFKPPRRSRAHSLGRAVLGNQFRIFRLKREQFSPQLIIGRVANLRRILPVIKLVMPPDFLYQLRMTHLGVQRIEVK